MGVFWASGSVLLLDFCFTWVFSLCEILLICTLVIRAPHFITKFTNKYLPNINTFKSSFLLMSKS